MKNKILAGFVLMLLGVMGAYAADFQIGIGAGGDFGLFFSRFDSSLPEPLQSQVEERLKNQNMNRGGFGIFLDLTYLEIDLGSKLYNVTVKEQGFDLKETQSYFNFGITGKYPFSINDRFSLFPLAGFDFQIFTKVKGVSGGYSIEAKRSDLSSRGLSENFFDRTVFNIGAGLDISITGGMFFRCTFIYGINFNTKYQKEAIDALKNTGYDVSILEHGPSIKLGLGYKF
ncbi:MAG: hypothetical protein LBD48_13130 [Treponema sp.]|jgi:opacity protein-like surface antigen|nr:hypothetical protein [Treponema sp.]